MKTPEEIILQVMTYGLASNGFEGNKWTQSEDGQWAWTEGHWKPAVQSVLEALDAAGFVIVPKAPTLQMLNAASEALVPSGDALACWHAMTAQNDESRHPEG